MPRSVRLSLFVLISVVTVHATTDSVLAQFQVKDPAVFEKIPVELRAKLLERLNVVFELQRKEDWSKLYDFVLIEDRPSSREEYVRRMKAWTGKMKPAKFTPDFISTEIYTREGVSDTSRFGEYLIMGCGEYGWGWFKDKYETAITARFQNGEWYFSDFLPTHESIDGPVSQCSKPSRRPNSSKPKKQQ